jgi:hypothetical protein
VHIPPRILQNQKASCLYTAIAAGCPELSPTSLADLAKFCRWILLVEFPDGASSNKRKMFFVAAELPGNVLFIPGTCCVHAAHRVVAKLEKLGGKYTLVGDTYACKFVMHLSSHYNRMYRILRSLIKGELLVMPRDSVSNSDYAAWAAHADGVLEHTVFRQAHHTRGRLIDGVSAPDNAAREALIKAKVMKFKRYVNGDLRVQRCMHVCDGTCCKSPEDSEAW